MFTKINKILEEIQFIPLGFILSPICYGIVFMVLLSVILGITSGILRLFINSIL